MLTLARKARAMPPGQLAGIARTRLNNRMRALAWKRLGWTPDRGRSVSPALAAQAVTTAARLLLGDRASELRSWLLRRPESVGRIVSRAEDVLAHRTSLLGSDRAYLGETIDWHRDWVTGAVWPREHFSDLDLLRLEDRCDVKRCWDLSRAYHWVWLAQAFWLTDDRRCLDEIERQWRDWIDRNPPEIGVNWASAMEASIRSVSWWWVLALTAGRLDPQLVTRACGSLQTHLDYMLGHLEFAGDGRNSNHLLADFAGLSFGGLIFADHPSSAAWRDAGLGGLWRELPLQVYRDGVNYEQSSEYHRFIAEFFLQSALLARRAGHEPGPGVWDRIERMLEVCLHLTRPDGVANAIGDGDDGRLSWLTDRAPLDFRGLLGVGAVIFDRGDFRYVAGTGAVAADPQDDVAWTLGMPGVEAFDRLATRLPASTTAAFTDGGVYVARTGWTADASHVVIDAGHLGMGPTGRGSHGHADTLSLCVSLHGQPVLIDPGTGIYTGHAEWRDAFRGGRMHNGVTVDGQALCAFDEGLFRWSSLCTPRVERWEESAGWVRFTGSHDGFERIEKGLRHHRSVWICRTRDAVVVHDRLDGSATHRLDAWFQFPAGAGVDAIGSPAGTWFARRGDAGGVLVPKQLTDTRVYVADERERLGWVSPSYGRWQAGTTVRVSAAAGRSEIVTVVALVQSEPGELLSLAGGGADGELASLLEAWF